jgi:hypothetical protein
MNDVDHKEICKFPSDSHPGYLQVVRYLKQLKDRIEKANAGAEQRLRHKTATTSLVDNGTTQASNSGQSPLAEGPKEQDAVAQRAIQAGGGKGGRIFKDDSSLVVGGGYASGATVNLSDLQKFTGTIEGGTGDGAKIQT